MRRAAEKWGDRPFLDVQGDIYSFNDIDRESNRMAHGLQALGVVAGQCVVTVLDNNVDAVISWFAINKLGAIAVPTNTAFKGEFLRHQVADTQAQVVIAESDYAERVMAVEDGIPDARILIWRGTQPSTQCQRMKLMSLDELLSDQTTALDIQVKPTDLCMLVYTGGTTGPSKGCMNSHSYMSGLARQAVIMGDRSDKSRWKVHSAPIPLLKMWRCMSCRLT